LCGIAGFTHRDWIAPPARIQDSVETLAHRGPDQKGVFRSSICSLGAARLKIIDLEGGDQPIFTDDGDIVIAFNGEIYNHRELRTELEERGHKFRSQSDTETVLHSFVEWDIDCFTRLRGMFAVALYIRSTARLVLARDRMGIKPLYIANAGADLFFGSELKAIFVHPEIERRLSLDGLDCYLSLNYVPCPWTLIDGIEKLPPGHWLEWQDGVVNTGSYWRLPLGEPASYSLETAKEELDCLLRQAVSEHLLSDVPLGMWLSGGIDSSTILHYAATASTSRLKTFSISFRGRSFDESAYIKQVAQRYDTDHEQLDLSPEMDLRGAIEQFAHYSDEPSADAGALPVWFLSKLSKTKTTVALSGEGADELFGGYLTYRANRLAGLARKLPSPLLRATCLAFRHWPVSDEKIGFDYKVKRFLEGCLMSPERAHVYWNGAHSDDEKAHLHTGDPGSLAAILRKLRGALSTADDVAPYLWFDQRYYLPDDILTKVDRISMAHSVEVRPPFLDHRIVEFAAKLPSSLKIRGGRQKIVLKELMKDKLPAAILRRKKIGFDIPAHEWIRGPLRSFVADVLMEGAAHHAELFRPEVIEESLRRHLERRVNIGYNLWGLMVLFLWMEKWQVQSTPLSSAKLSAPERAGIYI